ncbi:hypothetical protein [Sinimarinibacterium sp. CAU 1509]|nr:hypothetical protein [Sinimarinibacterium sp. CAU 1509]
MSYLNKLPTPRRITAPLVAVLAVVAVADTTTGSLQHWLAAYAAVH